MSENMKVNEIHEEVLDQVSGGTSPEGDIVYTVKRGDTLGRIARKYGTTVAFLAEYNNIADPDRIKAEQKIRIPLKH